MVRFDGFLSFTEKQKGFTEAKPFLITYSIQNQSINSKLALPLLFR